MNVNDKELILSVLEDYAEMVIGLDLDDRLPDVNRAISLLQRNFYKEGSKEDDYRQRELDFNREHVDWHHDPSLLDESEED